MKSSGPEDQLDEVHCLWALCPHPCCWETERRITEGVYRYVDRTQSKCRSDAEENSQFLSLVDVSDWSALSSGRTSGRRMPPLHNDSASRLKITSTTFPAIKSATDKWHTGEKGTRDKADKTAHISPPVGSPLGSGLLVLWVPNPRYVPQCLKSSKSLLCSVKELICPPAAQTPNTYKSIRKTATKWVRFQWADSVSPKDVTEDDLKRSVAANKSNNLRNSSVFSMRNKAAVLHRMQEKRVRRVSQDTLALLHKLDTKTGEKKRYNIPNYVSPPEGTRVAQKTVGPSFVSKPNLNRTLRSPKAAASAAWPCLCRKHPGKSGSELDMIIS